MVKAGASVLNERCLRLPLRAFSNGRAYLVVLVDMVWLKRIWYLRDYFVVPGGLQAIERYDTSS
jgi:hypothetical protein